MEMFEKVDMLRSRANVSYEDAKNALERSNGDVLEAMIILEREGKTSNQGAESANAGFAAQGCCDKNRSDSVGAKCKSLLHKSTVNYLAIDRKEERLVRIPVLAMVLMLLFAFPVTIIATVVALFLDCKFSFEGQDEMKAANNVCAKAGELAGQVKEKVVTEYNSL